MRKWRRQILSFILASVLRKTVLRAGKLAEVTGHEDLQQHSACRFQMRREEYECEPFHSNNAKESGPREANQKSQ